MTRRVLHRPIVPKIQAPKAQPHTAYYDPDLGLVLNNLTVYEVDEPLGEVSTLLQPNGEPIIYYFTSEKQGFTGFICPAHAEDNWPAIVADEPPEDSPSDDSEIQEETDAYAP